MPTEDMPNEDMPNEDVSNVDKPKEGVPNEGTPSEATPNGREKNAADEQRWVMLLTSPLAPEGPSNPRVQNLAGGRRILPSDVQDLRPDA